MKFSHLALLAVILQPSEAFVVPTSQFHRNDLARVTTVPEISSSTTCWGMAEDNEDNGSERSRPSKLRRLLSRTKKSLAFVALASSAAVVAMPKAAEASAPVMAMPKADVRDPLTDALENHQRRMQAQAQHDLSAMNAKARQIQAEEGPAAREKFEAEYKAEQEKEAQERLDGISKLKRDLLHQGICPFTDMEGLRQMFEAEKGLDPASVPGTRFSVEKEFETKSPQRSYAYQKQANRAMIKAMVEDMENRGMDPVEYFEKHQDKTSGILELPAAQASALAAKYNANLEMYGQITPPKEGEMSAKEKMAKSGKIKSMDKAEAKRLKAEAKEKAAAEKAAAKQRAQEEKAKAKAETAAAKEAAKKEKEDAKAAVAAAVAAATGAAVGAAEVVASTSADTIANAPIAPDSEMGGVEISSEEIAGEEIEGQGEAPIATKKSSKIPILPVSGVVVAVGGGGYALKLLRDKSAADEEERQRQFKLLMGMNDEDSPSSAPALEEVDTDMSDFAFDEEQSRPIEKTAEVESVPKKKKRLGIKSVFGKKKNERETDISAMVADDAKAPEFAKLLSKILTFGAPGRFPGIVALPGDMPMEKFDVDTACGMLTEAQESTGLTKEEAAEVFANVVNCMLIDIVDLASSTLKEKDDKLTVEAIAIVVNFMNHAASLYNSIAEGVVIKPVTYGGDLPKGKLEQMFTAYAASGMTNMMSMEEDFEDRVALLQDVFQINEKKAEGLVMKAVQKQMMEALKSGDMEGMEEMMKGMDLEGLAGMPGMGGEGSEDMSPEQLKEVLTLLKTMKDSGSIPDEEMKEVKEQFKNSFGASIEDVMKDAENDGSLGGQDKELLDLMKAVLYD